MSGPSAADILKITAAAAAAPYMKNDPEAATYNLVVIAVAYGYMANDMGLDFEQVMGEARKL